jgi:hypothetical protein
LYRFHRLEDVAKIMEERYGFRASIRGYRQRLAAWGAKKSDMEDSARSAGWTGNRPLEIVEWTVGKQNRSSSKSGSTAPDSGQTPCT